MVYTYTAIIVEPRKHKALEFVLRNACECLSNDWGIVLFHGTKNIDYSKTIVDTLNTTFHNRISTVNLEVDNLDQMEYSKLFATKSILYDFIPTELFLVFQTDSMIFKEYTFLLEEFLEYDYVGSPWLITAYVPTKECHFIGNGGFSLRRKSKMLEIIEHTDWNTIDSFIYKMEDIFFSKYNPSIPLEKPNHLKARTFCVDEVFSDVSFACHKPWVHNHYEIFKTIHPECEQLKELQDTED
jgi:hypothetical protein